MGMQGSGWKRMEVRVIRSRRNVSFEFTKEDFTVVRKTLLGSKEAIATSAGAVTPHDVTVLAQSTGLRPEKTFLSNLRTSPLKYSGKPLKL